MNVGVIGCWHLGSVVSTSLAQKHKVTVFDRVHGDILREGNIPVDEPKVKENLKKQLGNTYFVVQDISKAINGMDIIIIAYDTPVDDNDEVDLSLIFDAAKNISKHGTSKSIVVVMSQITVGTCAEIESITKLPVVYVPENLRLGNAMDCFVKPDVLVIGANDEKAKQIVSDELFSVVEGNRVFMRRESAEMWKHCMNTYLACMISLANSFADICEAYNANVVEVITALKMDARVSTKAPLGPGLGFGGGTLGRDVTSLKNVAQEKNISKELFDAILHINNSRPLHVIEKIGNVSGKTIAILGLTYKPGTNTLRRSLGIFIAKKLSSMGADVRCYDPVVDKVDGLACFKTADDACLNADALLFVTEWPVFRTLNWNKIYSLMRTKQCIDCRNMMTKENIQQIELAGLKYRGVGI